MPAPSAKASSLALESPQHSRNLLAHQSTCRPALVLVIHSTPRPALCHPACNRDSSPQHLFSFIAGDRCFVNRTAPGRTALVLSCLLTLPILTTAQSAPHPQSVSTLASIDLPDAPIPQNPKPQSSPPASQNPQQTTPSPQQSPQKNPNQPSLGDLGFTPQQTQANAQLQKRLNERTHDLKVHQTLGLITLAPMAAAVIAPAVRRKGA